MKRGYVPLFSTGNPAPTRIWCRLCGRRFRRWNGTANHGLMHRELTKGVVGAVVVETERTGEGTLRYVFSIPGDASQWR